MPFAPLDILGIRQAYHLAALQNIEYGFPVRTGVFHHVLTAGLRQSRFHRLYIRRESAELSHFHFGFSLRRARHQTHRQTSFADVNAGAVSQYRRNHTDHLPPGSADGSCYNDLAPRAAHAAPIGGSVTSARPV